jgi:probable phosphoglycerate mutase
MTRLLLVRHGETEWNREERFRGRADIPLNAKGLAQAEATARCIASRYQPAAVYASPLSRAVQTAEAIARRFSLPVQVHAGLADIDYGQWQGLSPDEVRARWPRLQAIREISHAHEDRTVVAVGHTVINRVILLLMLGM